LLDSIVVQARSHLTLFRSLLGRQTSCSANQRVDVAIHADNRIYECLIAARYRCGNAQNKQEASLRREIVAVLHELGT
jgi:hypothetical protein